MKFTKFNILILFIHREKNKEYKFLLKEGGKRNRKCNQNHELPTFIHTILSI